MQVLSHVQSHEVLDWEEMAPAPVDRLDGAGVQIGSLFYVFAGYQTIDEVLPPCPLWKYFFH